jgi:hypothetical protein
VEPKKGSRGCDAQALGANSEKFHAENTAPAFKSQIAYLVPRLGLAPSTARVVASLAFGDEVVSAFLDPRPAGERQRPVIINMLGLVGSFALDPRRAADASESAREEIAPRRGRAHRRRRQVRRRNLVAVRRERRLNWRLTADAVLSARRKPKRKAPGGADAPFDRSLSDEAKL